MTTSNKLWLFILVLLAAGGILWSIEGVLIGLWRVWFNPEASLVLKLMLPGTVIAFAAVIGLAAARARRSSGQATQAQNLPRG